MSLRRRLVLWFEVTCPSSDGGKRLTNKPFSFILPFFFFFFPPSARSCRSVRSLAERPRDTRARPTRNLRTVPRRRLPHPTAGARARGALCARWGCAATGADPGAYRRGSPLGKRTLLPPYLTCRSVSRAPEESGVPQRPRGRQSRAQVVPAAPPPPVPPPVAGPGPDLPAPLTLALSKCYPKQTDGGEEAVPRPRRAGAGARAGAGLGAVGAPLSPRDAAGAGERRARRFWWI